MSHDVQLLWFEGCTNHPAARQMLEQVIAEVAPGTPIIDVDATDPTVAEQVQFPGSPTIRVNGRDVDPAYTDPGDYTPRCRLYRTKAGLRGLPDRAWLLDALHETDVPDHVDSERISPLGATGGRTNRAPDPRT